MHLKGALTAITSLPAGLPPIEISMKPLCVTSGSTHPAALCSATNFSTTSLSASTRAAPASSGAEVMAPWMNARRPSGVVEDDARSAGQAKRLGHGCQSLLAVHRLPVIDSTWSSTDSRATSCCTMRLFSCRLVTVLLHYGQHTPLPFLHV